MSHFNVSLIVWAKSQVSVHCRACPFLFILTLRPFQVRFIPYILLTILSSLTLFFRSYFYLIGPFNFLDLCGSLPNLMVSETRCLCRALRPVSREEGILGNEAGSTHSFWPGFLLGGWLGWPNPIDRLVELSPTPLIRSQQPRVDQGMTKIVFLFIN